MTPEEAVQALDALPGRDAEGEHGTAENILLAFVPAEVRDAYQRAAARAGGYWYA